MRRTTTTGRFGLIAALACFSTLLPQASYAQSEVSGDYEWVGSGNYDVEPITVDPMGNDVVSGIQIGGGAGYFFLSYFGYDIFDADPSGLQAYGSFSFGNYAGFGIGGFPAAYFDNDPIGVVNEPISISTYGPGFEQSETLTYTIDSSGNLLSAHHDRNFPEFPFV